MIEEADRKSEKKKEKKEKKKKEKLLDGAKSDDVESPGFSDIYGGSGLATAPGRPMSVEGMNMMNAGGPGQGMGMQMPMTTGFTGGMNKMGNNMAMNQNNANMAMANQAPGYFEQTTAQKVAGGISIVFATAALGSIVSYFSTDNVEEGYPCPGIGLSWEETDCSKKNYYSEGFMLVNAHPVFMTSGTIFCGIFGANAWGLLQGVISKCSPANAHVIARAIHVTSFVASIVCIGLGLFAINSRNCSNEDGDENCGFAVYQLHHWVGLSVVVAFCLQFLFGLSSFVVSVANKPKLAMYHRAIGAMVLAMSAVAVLTGTEMHSMYKCHPSPNNPENLAEAGETTYLRVLPACKTINTFGILVVFAVAMALFATYPLVSRMKTM